MEYCLSSLSESLEMFNISFTDALQIFNKALSRNGSKIIASILSKQITEEQIDVMLSAL